MTQLLDTKFVLLKLFSETEYVWMIRRTYFAEVRETPRKHEKLERKLILGVPGFFVEGYCTRSVNLHSTVPGLLKADFFREKTQSVLSL